MTAMARRVVVERPRYSVREADLEHGPALLAGLGRQGVEAAGYDWRYRRNPTGRGRVYLLWDEALGQAVGAEGVVPRHLCVGGKSRLAATLADLTVDRRCREAAAGLRLLHQAVHSDPDYFHLLYGCPAPAAAAIYRQAGYMPAAVVRRYHLALTAAGPGGLRSLAPATRQRWLGQVDGRLDRLWQAVEHGRWIIARRGAAFLHWRFFSDPPGRHRLFVAEQARGGRMSGYAVTSADAGVLHVRDFLGRDRVALAALFTALAARARYRGCTVLALEFAGDPAIDALLRRLGFVPQGQRPLFVIPPRAVGAACGGPSWYWTEADDLSTFTIQAGRAQGNP